MVEESLAERIQKWRRRVRKLQAEVRRVHQGIIEGPRRLDAHVTYLATGRKPQPKAKKKEEEEK